MPGIAPGAAGLEASVLSAALCSPPHSQPFSLSLFFDILKKMLFEEKKLAAFSDVLIKRPISRLIREPFICSFADRSVCVCV